MIDTSTRRPHMERALAFSVMMMLAAVAAQPALAAKKSDRGNSKPEEMNVTFGEGCLSAEVYSSKDLSNIVVELVTGEKQKFEDFAEGSHFFNIEQTDSNETAAIAFVYVKSGSEKSGKLEGFGHVGVEYECESVEDEVADLSDEDEFFDDEEEGFFDDEEAFFDDES